MKTTRALLGARIKELRKLRQITQEQLAEKVDLATRYISLIEVGRSSPSLETNRKHRPRSAGGNPRPV